jgi:hypothetical protein
MYQNAGFAALIYLMTAALNRPDLGGLRLGDVPMVLMHHVIDEASDDPVAAAGDGRERGLAGLVVSRPAAPRSYYKRRQQSRVRSRDLVKSGEVGEWQLPRVRASCSTATARSSWTTGT